MLQLLWYKPVGVYRLQCYNAMTSDAHNIFTILILVRKSMILELFSWSIDPSRIFGVDRLLRLFWLLGVLEFSVKLIGWFDINCCIWVAVKNEWFR